MPKLGTSSFSLQLTAYPCFGRLEATLLLGMSVFPVGQMLGALQDHETEEDQNCRKRHGKRTGVYHAQYERVSSSLTRTAHISDPVPPFAGPLALNTEEDAEHPQGKSVRD